MLKKADDAIMPVNERVRLFCVLVLASIIFLLPDSPVYSNDRAESGDKVISRIKIDIIGRPEQIAKYSGIAEKLITFKEGDLFSGEKLQESIYLLKGSRLFKTIDIPDPDFDRPEIVLLFRLTPFTHIKDIRIQGGFPLFEQKILNVMTIYTGDVFKPEKLEKQESKVELLFLEAGYITPKARVTAEEDPADGNHVVTVQIDKGEYYRIRHVEVYGNESFWEARLKLRTDAWKSKLLWSEAKRYDKKKLDDDLDNLKQFYREKGYYDVGIKPVVENSPGSRSIYIRIIIDEGPKYKIRFKGNKEFWDYTLKKDLVLEGRGNKNDIGLKRSIRNMRERYVKAGYEDVRILMEEDLSQKRGKPIRTITFVIDEGDRSVIRSLTIFGNESVKTRRIKKQMLTESSGWITDGEFHGDTLAEDIKAIQALYLKHGFMKAEVTEEVRWQKDSKKDKKHGELRLSIGEGMQTRVGGFTFNGLTVMTQDHVIDTLALENGGVFNEELLNQDEASLAALISEKGYPHVNVSSTYERVNDGALAWVTFDISEGPFVTMGEVYSSGNFRTRDAIIDKEVELEPGEPFSLVKMLESQRNIRNLNAFKSANFKLPGLNEHSETVNLFVEAEERKPYYFQMGLGYDTKRKAYANTRLGDRNVMGLNKDAWAAVEYSEIGYRGEAGITEPRFLGTRISSTLNMFTEELEEFNKDYGTQTYGGGLTFSRRFLDYFRSSLSFRYEYRKQFLLDSGETLISDEEQYRRRNIFVTTPSIIYDTTDSYVRPQKGVYASYSVDISKGVSNAFDDFLKHRLEIRYFYTPVDKLTFAVRGRYGYIEPGESNTKISEDQLFFLGGTSDVRGYEENMLRYNSSGEPVGGRAEALGSFEARYNVWNNLEITSFYDIGSIRYTYEDDDHDGVGSSVGTGLRYITPIGPIGFLYGWKIGPEDDESSGNLHFTIGHTF